MQRRFCRQLLRNLSNIILLKRERLLEAAYIRIQFSQGPLSSGDEWLTKRHISANDKPNVAREYEQITLARMLMVRQAYQKLEVKNHKKSRF